MTPLSLLQIHFAALVLCLYGNVSAFLPASTHTSPCSRPISIVCHMSTTNDENEIKNEIEMVKTEELQWETLKETVERQVKTEMKKVEQKDVSLDKYHFTTKSNKELIFDERTGRFFETSITPGSLHQLWQEYLAEEDDPIEEESVKTTNFAIEMIPTELLFGKAPFEPSVEEEEAEECLVHTPYQDSCESTPWNVLDDHDDEITSGTKNKENMAPTIVDECYKAWNRRDMKAAAKCFTFSGKYKDYQYVGTISGRQQLEEHFTQQANLLPPNCQIVVDHLAYDIDAGKIATQWHLERPNGSTVRFTKGCSFYTLNEEGLIKSGFRTSEMAVKPNRDTVNALLSLAPKNSESSINTKASDKSSVVERYLDAWNRRDMEAALDCLEEDLVYQTEDSVFVGTLNGKPEMRIHLEQNANVLPAAAQIVLDDLAVDSRAGKIGTRWHLEVNGVGLPNLQGCSMYTISDNGKIQTALDITEAPIKLPRAAVPFLSAPAMALFDLL